MKTLSLTFLTGLSLFGFMNASLSAASREAQWKKVDEAIEKGLPQTAITNLLPIIEGALKDKAWGEATKALARRIVLEGAIQGNKPEEKIVRMEAEIAKTPPEMKPLLQTVLATWYWHYFQQNKWRFMRRTATAEAPGQDFTTWDLPRLFAEIDKQFQAALAAEELLKKTPVSAFDDLLVKGTLPDKYRPTLYDFLAHEALKFYTSGEQAAAKPQDAYELSADGPIFDPAEKFLAWHRTFAAKDFPDSPIVKALDLYGKLLAFHEKDQDPTAFVDVDLARLVYGYNVAFGEARSARYKAALQAFVDKWADHEVSALALHHWAQVLHGEREWVEARKLAQRGRNAHRDSPGGRLCHNLVQQIEAKSASVTTERVWNWSRPADVPPPPAGERAGVSGQNGAVGPTVNVHYRNVTKVWLRAVAWDWEHFFARQHSRPEWLDDKQRAELLSRKPALEWSADLPATPDFKPRTQALPAPATLKPGFYFLLASHKPDFSPDDNVVSYTDVWVSELALVMRPREGNLEGFVLEAGSGEPVQGAEVMGWTLDDNGKRVALGPAARTDESGFFSMPGREHRGALFRVRHNGRELASAQEYASWRSGRPGAQEQTIFFTDRALYRPGQTISYKGILLRVDAGQNDYELLKGRRVTVHFLDPNGKEVAKAEHVCNDYGSFSGSFTAPRDRLMGRYQIHAINGRAWFNVEEYKRPKFQVKLDAPKTAARLNDKVVVPGKAEAYTGAAVDDALVKWRVVREVRWPDWWGWWGWRRGGLRGGESQEIAHGTARTGADGSFQIEFTARPDPKVSDKDEASFTFRLHADVTDGAGETRSDQRGINVGFVALRASLTASDWQTEDQPVELKIRTTTLDDEPQAAEGSVKVYRLKAPARMQRAPLQGGQWQGDEDEDGQPDPDFSNPNNWELADVAVERGFTTDAEGNAKLEFKLGVGAYRVMLETQDRFGRKVTARLPLQVLKPDDPRLAIRIPRLLAAPKWSLEPGEEFLALWGTGYDAGRAFVEIEHRQQMVERFWTQPGRTQQQIRKAVTEAMRGGFTLHVTQVRENRAYLDSRRVEVPWSNKELELKWEHFVSKLQPGQKETWTLQIRSPKSEIRNAERTVAEVVAGLYDESLDQFQRHDWMRRFHVFYQDHSSVHFDFANTAKSFQQIRGSFATGYRNVDLRYRKFPPDLVANIWGYGGFRRARGAFLGRQTWDAEGAQLDGLQAQVVLGAPLAAPAPSVTPIGGMATDNLFFATAEATGVAKGAGVGGAAPAEAPAKGPDLSQVTARRNLNETAFFFPQLTSDSNGVVRLTFTMPEALTQWRFLGFAHDTALRSGFLEGRAVTAKDLMVQPNPPRFLREGDTLEFTVKVSNQSAARQQGKARLTFTEAATEKSADALLGNSSPELDFDIPARESRSYSWRITVPDGAPFLAYKAVASTGRMSDGEEGYLPVLSRYLFVTESLPLPIRGQAGGPVTKKFQFEKLLQSGQSDTLRHQNLVVQMVSNPSWYAVLALPYLMEFPHECSEQVFNRLYANALARHIANSDPKIRRIFDQWKGTPALDSPLEKNQDLKAVMLEETPWLRQAQNESQARKNVGVLFDDNRLKHETERAFQKLAEMQLPDGAWPWFPGGRGNDYITLYITSGFGRLRHLGADLPVHAAVKSLNRLDNWMDEHYARIQRDWKNPDEYVPSPTDALYMYGRSFFLKDQPVAKNREAAVNFFLKQARKHWLKTDSRQTQGHLALALKRFNAVAAFAVANDPTPADIMKSLKERSVTSEELGMFWRDTELSWWWYRAPIETQALMLEAFDEVAGDQQAVEECRVWLLKQKQTQDWKTTKATADAIYGLLLRGKDILASDKLVEVTVGGVNVLRTATRPDPRDKVRGPKPEVEPGTGFYEVRFAGPDVKPALGEVTVRKVDEGVAWGSVHWQYLEDMSKVTPYEGTPLKLKKTLYTKVNTARGPELRPVKSALAVGDELVVRIELRVDRDMEYVHLKDQRGSGTEPVNVLSRYQYQDGLAYYESTRDTASHFFIDYLPKGAYVFEYSTRVQHRGAYQTGMAGIQCMYAPEFNSHSESLPLTVK